MGVEQRIFRVSNRQDLDVVDQESALSLLILVDYDRVDVGEEGLSCGHLVVEEQPLQKLEEG